MNNFIKPDIGPFILGFSTWYKAHKGQNTYKENRRKLNVNEFEEKLILLKGQNYIVGN